MKVLKNGLVPVKFLRGVPPYNANEIAGLPPAQARSAVKAGHAVLHEIPEGVETVDSPDPEPEKAPDVPRAVAAIEIPDDWEKMHHLQRINLAIKVNGGDFVVPDGKTRTEAADAIITAEIERRTAPPAA